MSTLPTLTSTKYVTTLPSNKKSIDFRPFLVKEEKIFLLAIESGENSMMIQAVKNVIDNCTFNQFDINKLPMVDLEWIFLELRKKSKGEIVELRKKCSNEKCEQRVNFVVNLEEVKLDGEMPDNKIFLQDDIGIVLRYPSVGILDMLTDTMSVQDQFNMIRESIDCVFTNDEVFPKDEVSIEDMDSFLDSITDTKFKEIDTFFKSVPQLKWENKNIVCEKCGTINEVMLKGLKPFL